MICERKDGGFGPFSRVIASDHLILPYIILISFIFVVDKSLTNIGLEGNNRVASSYVIILYYFSLYDIILNCHIGENLMKLIF